MKLRTSLTVISALVFFCISGTAFAMTETELQTMIAQLQAQIAQLQAQLVQTQNTAVSTPATTQTSGGWCFTFNKNLVMTNSGVDVKNLQIALEKEGFVISAEEKTQSYFDSSTRAAAKKFQEKYSSEILTPYGLSSGTGGVGIKTRDKLNSLYGCNMTVCSEGNWMHNLSPVVCPSTGEQTKIWTKIGTCSGGVSHPITEKINCNPQATICNYFMYSDWSACNQSKIQTRTVTFSSPSGCQGGNPITTRTCDLVTTPTCTSFVYSGWSDCNQSETQTSGIQTRTIVSSLPIGCEGGNPALSQVCVNTTACSNNNWKYTLSPTVCPSTGQQTKTWTKIGTCTGGITHPATETVNCVQQTPTPTDWCYTFVNHLLIGNSGVDVKNLQIALEKEGYTIPSQEKSQSYFGVYTKGAVMSFQEKYASEVLALFKLKIGTGRVGVTTIAKLNQLYGCETQAVCNPNWYCGDWSSCVNGQQTRICIDTNNCGVETNKPTTAQTCFKSNNICPMDAKLCPDGSYVGRGGPNCEFLACPVTSTPITTCISNWQCSDWSECDFYQQKRICTDSNQCVAGNTKKEESMACTPSEERLDACLNNIPGLNISCFYGLAPYNTSDHTEMNISQMNYLLQSVGSYTPEESCGCNWIAWTEATNRKISCPTSKLGCDFTKVPDELPRKKIGCDNTKFPNSWKLTTEINPVEWSSRIAKGESYEQALQNTTENQKRIGFMIAEKQCIKEKIDEYYIGGESSTYPGWMCEGEKYRLDPNSTTASWQKWVNGAWTTGFGWNAAHTCQ